MSRFRMTRFLLSCVASLWVILPETAAACSACFGKSDSTLAQGMNMGILTLMIFILSVLAAIASFFVFLAKKSAASSLPK